jgi:hypothetical protein
MQLQLDVSPAKEAFPMPQTKAPRATPARKAAAGTKHSANANGRTEASAVNVTTELSDDVLKSLESGQRAAIEAVRKFVDTVDERLPALGGRPSRRQDIIDAAMEMSDRLVQTQYEFLRNVVQSAGKALGKPEDGK